MWPVGVFSSLASYALLARPVGKFFMESSRSRQLELLPTTPLGRQEILSGQWRALKAALGGPVSLMLLGVGIVTLVQLGDFPIRHGSSYLISLCLNITVTLSGIVAICWVAMWFAFRGYGQIRIISRAVAFGTVVPGAFRVLMTLLIDPRISVTYGEWPWMLRTWAEEIAVLIYYLWLFGFAKRRLEALLPPFRGSYARLDD